MKSQIKINENEMNNVFIKTSPILNIAFWGISYIG